MKTTTKINKNTIRSLIKDETMASKMYSSFGKKYNDPILKQMSRDEKKHHDYWVKVMREKKEGGFKL